MEYRSKNLRVRSSRGLPMTSSALPYSTMTPPSMNNTLSATCRANCNLVGDDYTYIYWSASERMTFKTSPVNFRIER